MRKPEPLPPDIAQLLERGAAATEPPIAVRERLRGRLATALASPVTLLRPIGKTGGGLAGALMPSRALVGAFTGFVLGAASMWALRGGAVPAAPAPAVAASLGSTHAAPGISIDQPEARPSGPTTAHASEIRAAAAPGPAEVLPARIAMHRFVRKARSAAATAEAGLPAAPPLAAPSNPTSSPTHWGLEAEGELLQKGRTAMVRGDTEGALAAVEEHAARFPHGKLVEEREALKIQVLVAEDRTPEARAAFGAFELNYPRSLLGPALKEAVVGRIQ